MRELLKTVFAWLFILGAAGVIAGGAAMVMSDMDNYVKTHRK